MIHPTKLAVLGMGTLGLVVIEYIFNVEQAILTGIVILIALDVGGWDR